MAVYSDVLPTTDLKYEDIRDTLNANGGSVNNDVSTAFKTSSGINVWSKHKPVPLNTNFCQDFDSGRANYNATWWRGNDGNCGLIPKTLFNFSEVVDNTDGGMNGWTYDVPIGGSSEPLRLGDFSRYCPAANPPVSSLNVQPTKVVYNSESTINVGVNIRIGNNDRSLTFEDFPTLKNYYFGVYCTNTAGNKIRATSSNTVGARSASIELNTKGLPRGKYKCYPFLAESSISQSDPDKAMVLYTLPNLSPVKFEVVSEHELYSVTVSASVTGTLKNEITWTVYFTQSENAVGSLRFTNLRMDFRFPDNAYDDLQDVGEVRENFDIDVRSVPGQRITVKTGTTRIISPELLQDCKVWATLYTGDNQTYIGNTYTHN